MDELPCENSKFSKLLFDGGYFDVRYGKTRSIMPPHRSPDMTDEEYQALIDSWHEKMRFNGMHMGFKFYNRDHLGSVREVMDASGEVEQTNDYYPFGTPIYRADGSTNSQKYKFNGKEFDEMHGLSSLDYGARQYYPVLPLWDRVDPKAEDYYHVSPYSYCLGDPVNCIDPDGKEVLEGVGPTTEDNIKLKQLSRYLVAHDDPNSIMIVAHGGYDNEDDTSASTINIMAFNSSTKKWNNNIIKNGKDLDKFLSANSKTWNKFKKGEIKVDDLHIVFYCCGSSNIVEEISSDDKFKDVTFIAPTTKLGPNRNGKLVVGETRNKKVIYGVWATFINGRKPFLNSTYPGNEHLYPGIKGFSYKMTLF